MVQQLDCTRNGSLNATRSKERGDLDPNWSLLCDARPKLTVEDNGALTATEGRIHRAASNLPPIALRSRLPPPKWVSDCQIHLHPYVWALSHDLMVSLAARGPTQQDPCVPMARKCRRHRSSGCHGLDSLNASMNTGEGEVTGANPRKECLCSVFGFCLFVRFC